jgi:hypothetical protein
MTDSRVTSPDPFTLAIDGRPLIEGCVTHVARKLHHCQHCPETIKYGEAYIEYLGDVPAYQSGKRYHLDCALEALTVTEGPRL